MTLHNLVTEVGGWPIKIEAVALLLRRADTLLPEGREYRGELTAAQVAALMAPRDRGRPATTAPPPK